MPVYNTEIFLRRTLDSLCEQTFQDIEILCIDDGSTDDSGKILEEYATQNQKVKVFHQQNLGPAAARNLGLEKASGKYLMFCDSDDWYEPTMCEEMVKALEVNDVDLVACDTSIREQDKNHSRAQSDVDYNRLKIFGRQELTNELKAQINIVLWNKILKKDIVDRYEIKFPNGFEHDDMAFMFLYLEVARTIFGLEKKLYNYVLRQNSIMAKLLTKKNFNKKYDIIYSLSFILTKLQKHQLLNNKTYFFRFMEGHLLWSLRMLDERERLAAFTLCQNEIISKLGGENLTDYQILDNLAKNNKSWLLQYTLFCPHTKKIRFLGINLAKIKYDIFCTKYYLLGMRVLTRKSKKLNSIAQSCGNDLSLIAEKQ